MTRPAAADTPKFRLMPSMTDVAPDSVVTLNQHDFAQISKIFQIPVSRGGGQGGDPFHDLGRRNRIGGELNQPQ